MSASTATAHSPLSEELLRRFDAPGPRYTSYPSADRFTAEHGAEAAQRALIACGRASAGRAALPLALYVHLPFCESLCYYCACNKVVTRHHERAAAYLDALQAELQMVRELLGDTFAQVAQLHLGGGTPTFLSDAELQRLMDALGETFRVALHAEKSIEVDPRTVTPARLAALRRLGFQRLSLGVQDFDPQVQQAVHRIQPFAQVRALMNAARSLGFESINTDLIYGLPRQTPQSFARTLAQLAELRPDRIALYRYAHLPERFKSQRRIRSAELPDASQRVAMLRDAVERFMQQGYQCIGMDHFALPQDELAIAKNAGKLQRNFQGYSAQPDVDLIGVGVSAISRVGETYHQNTRDLVQYTDCVTSGRLPVVRGLALDSDDRLRRRVIGDLMCQGRVDFDAIGRAHGVDVAGYFAGELQALQALERDGLVQLGPRAVQLTDAGWYVVRAVAMVFDSYLRDAPQGPAAYSRVL